MYAAVRPQAPQCRVTWPPCASSDEERSGVRSTWLTLQDGHTSGFWSRSAAIRISASGARYSLMPRRPTVGPSGGVWWHGSGSPPNISMYGIPRARKGARGPILDVAKGLRLCEARADLGGDVRRCHDARRHAVGARRPTWSGWTPIRRRRVPVRAGWRWSSGHDVLVFKVVSGRRTASCSRRRASPQASGAHEHRHAEPVR